MTQNRKHKANYKWAKKHITDFERYLAEQCQPHFEEVAAEESSQFMAPMWWSVGYVILRGMADKKSVSADDTDKLTDRAMLLLELLTHSEHPIFHEILQTFVLPMAKALDIDKDNDAINEHIFKSIAFIAHKLKEGETLSVPELNGPDRIIIKREETANADAASTTEDRQIQDVTS